jgi:hypothetical protein
MLLPDTPFPACGVADDDTARAATHPETDAAADGSRVARVRRTAVTSTTQD